MASQSSAVLDLNDADVTDDTDAPSVSEDVEEVPLIMEHGDDIVVKVDSPMKQLSTLETYVTYRVRCVCARWPTPPYVRRRYNHFKELHRRLSARHPWQCVAALPALHSAAQQLDRYSARFVAARAQRLCVFLEQICQHPILTHSEDLKIFLTTPDEEFDKIFKNENSALNLWGLGSAFYGNSEHKSTNGPRVKDPEFTAAAEYLGSLQGKLSALYNLTVKLYKGLNALGADCLNFSRVSGGWLEGGRRGAGAGGAVGGVAAALGSLGAARTLKLPARVHALPHLAATAAAQRTLLNNRAQLHGEYVAGNCSSDDLHNRLEQATEAIRSELAYWLPLSRRSARAALLQLAESQLGHHAHALAAWESALRAATTNSTAPNSTPAPQELFKTVSKNALFNLSPSKCKTLAEHSDAAGENQSSDSSGSVRDLTTDAQDSVEEKVSDPLQSFSDVDLS